MSSAFHLQLLLFTVLGPSGAVGFVIASLFAIFAPKKASWAFRLQRCLLIPIAVCMVGLVIAATHLGTPRNALYVLLGAGRSPLSNEMVATLLFLALAWLFWLMLATRRMPTTLAKGWLVVASVAGLAMVAETALAYSIETIPAWNSPVAPWMFLFGSVVLGCAVALGTLRTARVEIPRWSWWTVVALQGAGVLGGAVAMVMFRNDLEGVSSALVDLWSLVPNYELFVGAFSLLGFAAVASAALGLITIAHQGQEALSLPPAKWLVASAAFAAFAVVAMRIPFYLLYMTVGL